MRLRVLFCSLLLGVAPAALKLDHDITDMSLLTRRPSLLRPLAVRVITTTTASAPLSSPRCVDVICGRAAYV